MSDTIFVKAAKNDNRVAVWDQDKAHPNGEIFITGDGQTHEVARTAKVERALGSGKLVVVPAPKEVEVKKEKPGKGKKGVSVVETGEIESGAAADGE